MLEQMIESAAEIITITDVSDRITFVNKAFLEAYGYASGEILGRHVSILRPRQQNQRLGDEITSSTLRDKWKGELINVTKDGREFPISLSTSQIRSTDGSIVGLLGIAQDLSERRRAESALQLCEGLNRQILESVPAGILRFDLNGLITAGNDRACQILGLSMDELLRVSAGSVAGRAIWESGRECPAEEFPFQQCLRTLQPQPPSTLGLYRGDGSLIWAIFTAVPVLDPLTRDLTGVVVTFIDITPKQQSERALVQERNLLRTLIDHLPDYIYVKDKRSVHLINNRAILAILGAATMEETIGKTAYDYFPYDLARRYIEDDQRVMTSGEPMINREEPIINKEGKPGWLLTTKIPLYDGDGKLIGLVGISRDITEWKKTETEIKKLAAFPRYNPNPVLEFDEAGSLTYFNQAAMDMARSLSADHPIKILPRDTLATVLECLRSKEGKIRLETVINGRTLAWSFFCIPAIRMVHCYAADITERIHLEGQLRQAQKMESIGKLAGGIAHDFNNILTVIEGHASLLTNRENVSADIAETAREIAQAAERAANLTKQLLMFSRRQIMQPRNLDLNEIIANITKMLSRIVGEDISVHVEYGSGLPPVSVDAGMIGQVLVNLTVNARDAMPNGGRLVISSSVRQIDAAYARVSQEASAGQFVALRVSDTGCGIPAEHLPHVFEPFFTTKAVGKGTGLGLATAYGIVKQHQGWIEIQSEVGHGSSFTVYLPAAGPGLTGAVVTRPDMEVRGGKETLLLVEDEATLRSLAKKILHRYGYHVLDAGTGAEAIEVWEKHQASISLLLTDLVMPGGMNGRELAARLLEANPELKVIYTSGYSADVLGEDARLDENAFFLQKPYHPSKLIQIIRDALDRG